MLVYRLPSICKIKIQALLDELGFDSFHLTLKHDLVTYFFDERTTPLEQVRQNTNGIVLAEGWPVAVFLSFD